MHFSHIAKDIFRSEDEFLICNIKNNCDNYIYKGDIIMDYRIVVKRNQGKQCMNILIDHFFK